jgi:hypothetical protein
MTESFDWGMQMPHSGVAGGLDVEKNDIAEWKLDKDGMAIKSCAVKRVDGTVTYGLIIAKRDEDGDFDDPRNLTREQMVVIRDFLGFVLEDSEG